MKSLRSLLLMVLMGAATVAVSQEHKMDAPKTVAPPSEAQKSFATIKSLAGEWEGPVATDMSPELKKMMGIKDEEAVKPLHVTMRVTSRGNVLVHEFQEAGTPLDPKKYDHPVTMLYVDQDKLNLVHYCDAGNRPHMAGKVSPDGKKVEFDFVDLSGGNKLGHMYHAVFTMIDADHHSEDWTYLMPGDKPMKAHMELQRKKDATSVAGQ